ncbi:MAG: energy-coupling factor transporter ATPase [Clostridia bacterium]|jgi:energy-coupling factor transport system ATP-binding protein|nr:energy-coupling factor transporter ATPase [Clostridia bacterium]MBR2850754.1 energy-coupling factor transporter ATPase [Clostridia bacterium]
MSDKITVENLSYFHARKTPYEIKALDGIDLNIQSGTVTGLIGHTGSGKSTLVQMFNGLLRPYEGRVLLDGADIWAKPKDINKIRFRVGLVMQYPEYQLFEETIYKDIAYGPKNMGLSDDEIRERVLEAADFVGLDRELLDKSPFDLSGGQKRRAAIAGIIAMRPELLILDEPAAGLDPRGRDAIFNNIVEYQKKSGSTVLIVSHSMEDMARYCDRLIVMSGAKILLEGECREIFTRADELSAVGLDVPQITRLMLALKEKGIELDTSVFTVEEALEEILRLYQDK